MKRAMGLALKVTASSLVIGFLTVSPASGQYLDQLEDYYGSGVEGTIGRGTHIVPGGASDPRTRGRMFDFTSRRSWYPNSVYSRGYASPPVASAPYRTTQQYAPGDGYRYPLYYNPATRTYFYYPVRR